MRKLGFVISGGAVLLMAVALVDGQQPQPKGGGFGGFGGFGTPAPGASSLNLLNNKDVKKELDLTDEQLTKLPDEVLVAISKVLNEKQYKRFKQIELQQRGNRAFGDTKVQTALKINEEQKKNIASILEDANKELAEAAPKFGGFGGKGGGGGFGKGNAEKIEKINADAKDKILAVLTKQQRKEWREMVGEEFKMTTPAFGGFGGGFGKKDAKKDTDK
jgi:hypothetical protein